MIFLCGVDRWGHGSAVEAQVLGAARQGDEAAFKDLVEPHRRGLMAHCYRMLGSLQDAEDSLQETLLRAWRGLDGFQERSSFQTWLYRIATHATLDALKHAKARALPPANHPASKADAPLAAPIGEAVWLEPYPNALLPDPMPTADAVLSSRESVSFAFLQALQRLPAKQRAALLLKDVIGSSSSEVAELLDTTVAATNSLLQRARDTLGQASPPDEAADREREIVAQYVQVWESANVDALVSMLRDDARLSMPPIPSWFEGAQVIGSWLRQAMLSPSASGQFRGILTGSNGLPAVALYQRQGDVSHLNGIHVLEVQDGMLAEITAFMDPAVLRFFDVPATMKSRG